MATGETRTIDSDLTLTSKYEMTQYDDTLNIIGATVTLAEPAGDILTNEGNDTVTVTDSTITASASGLSFMLGGGDDTLNVQNSIIDAPMLTETGNDTVVITGDKQSKVTLKKLTEDTTLSLGVGNDVLELVSILDGDGDVTFGTGTDTLRFNGGSLLTTGSFGIFSVLDVMAAGGILGRELILAGEDTQIILNGALFGTSAGKIINISDSTTTLTAADNIQTDVTLALANVALTQADGGTLEFAGHSGYAITANDSTLTLHNIITQSGQVFSGNNTVWNISDSAFANSTNGIDLTGGSIELNNVGMSDYTDTALKLTGTKLTGAQLAFANNVKNGAIRAANADMEIIDLQMSDNITSASCVFYYEDVTATAHGGAISHTSGDLTITSANFSTNIASAPADIFDENITATAHGGAISHTSGDLTLISADFSGNIAVASALCMYGTGIASAHGGAISHTSCDMTFTSVNFSGNIAVASASGGYLGSLASAQGGAISHTSGDMTLTDTEFSGNIAAASGYYAVASAQGGAISHTSGDLTLTSAGFSGNIAAASGSDGVVSAQGGAISHTSGDMTLTSAGFSGNIAAASGYYACASAMGGGAYIADAIVNLTDTTFTGNIASASSEVISWTASYGGALYLSNTTMTYTVTSGTELTNTGNQAQYGGFLYMADNSTADFVVEDNALLTIGDDTDNDSIAGDGLIQKQGKGCLLINSDISGYSGTWSVSDGTLELARIARTIKLDDWTFGENAQVILSSQDDTINMSSNKGIAALDLGGGSDVINTNGYALSNGTLRISQLKFTGGGEVSSTITNRDPESGFDLTLDGITLAGNIQAADVADSITVSETSTISGEVDLGGGQNVVNVEDTLTMTGGAVKMTQGGETRIVVNDGAALTNNTLTVYADAGAERETVTYSWANQTDLDKVRLLVSSDSTFETFEFAVELCNNSKSFTLDMEKGYFVQFQANDEEGWKQHLVDDTVAPDQVTGVEFNGSTLTWDVTRDNLGGNGVKQYTVEVATDNAFTDVVDTHTVTETEYVPQGLVDGTYYFRVCAEDYTANIGEWSTTVSGQIDTTPPTRPTGGKSSVDGYNVTLSWNAATDTGSGVAEYEYRVASDSSYSTIIRTDTTETLTVTENDLANGTYYWQVRAIDNAGNVGDWSETGAIHIGTITITANSKSKQYDGTALTDSGYTYSEAELISGDVLTAVVEGTITNAGTAENKVVSYKIMRGTEDVTGSYSAATKVSGTLSVGKRNVTLTSATDSKYYDGEPLINDTITVSGDGFVGTESYSADVTGTQTEIGNSANTFTYTLINGALDQNYNITKEEGTLTVMPLKDIAYTLSGNVNTLYDGEEHSVSITVTTPASGCTVSYSLDGKETWQAGNSYSMTNAGSQDVYFKVEAEGYQTLITDSRSIFINKRNVTLTSATDSKYYDGEPLTNDTITVSGDGFVGAESYSADVTGTQTEVGSSKNAFTYTLTNGALEQNYNITTVEGLLTVTALKKIEYTLSENVDTTYDGTAHTVSITVTGPVSGYAVFYSLDGQQTWQAGNSYSMTDAGNQKVYFKVEAAEYETVIDSSSIAIAKRSVTLASNTDSRKYDGTALTGTVTVGGDGFVEGEATVAGSSLVNAGEITNSITVNEGTGFKASNYNIDKIEGVLTVEKRQISLTSGDAAKEYDGEPLTNDTVTMSGDGFAGEESYSVNVTGSQTAIGSRANTFTYTLTNGALEQNYNITAIEGHLSVTGETSDSITGNFTGKGGTLELTSKGEAYIRTADGVAPLTGTVDIAVWEIVGAGDFNGSGKEGLLWLEEETGYAYMQYDMTSLSEVTGKTNCLGQVEEGHVIMATGDFSGTGIAGALMQGPAFGDPEVSLNYGLSVWARESDGTTFNGCLGALVNTWQEGDALKGDLNDPVSINANNYQYAVVDVGDFNGDGRDDVMLKNIMPEVVTQGGVDYTITGSGDIFTFLTGDTAAIKRGDDPTVCYAGCTTNGWEILGTGDFDNDGIEDILLGDGGHLAGWKMSNGQRVSDFLFGNMTSDQEFAGIADFNNDGTDDILIRDTAGTLTAWTVQNGSVTGSLALK